MPALIVPLLLAPPLAPPNEGEPDLWEAVAAGAPFASLRYRFEHVDADAFDEEADASTLRSVLGYETGTWRGFRGLVEFESVAPIGAENYDSTVNGKADHPVVADPETTEVNQLYVDYVDLEALDVRLGRQEIVLDDARFVGNVGWRQNHQSYDAVTLDAPDLGGFAAKYAYVAQVNRIFGDDSPAGDEGMSTHLLNVSRAFEDVGEAVLYAYVLDFDESTALSTTTLGGRFAGGRELDGFGLDYALELATQSDSGDNDVDVDQEYYRVELGGSARGVSLKVGQEELGGSGAAEDKFTTPLATLHAHNGFADVFLTTPDEGLVDRYVTLGGEHGAANAAVTYHAFESDADDVDYGTEVDAVVGYRVSERVRVGLKLAAFDADEAFEDVTKLMGWVSVGVL